MKGYPEYWKFPDGTVAKACSDTLIIFVTLSENECIVQTVEGQHIGYAYTADYEPEIIAKDEYDQAYGKALWYFSKVNAIV